MFDEVERNVRLRQPEYPPQQSAAGTNTYTVQCAVVGWRPGYAVCAHKIMAYERDRGLKSYPDCERGIRNKECPAIAMRAEEAAAGKALYYVDRVLLREEMDKHLDEMQARMSPSRPRTKPVSAFSAAAASRSKPIETPRAPEPKKSSSIVPDVIEDGYAAAINAAIRESSAPVETPRIAPITKPEPKVVDPSPSPVKKGLSLLEMARMQMGKQPAIGE
jgi:hypothetical protein